MAEGPIRTLSIALKSNRENYQPGDLLEGEVVLDLTNEAFATGFNIKLVGQSCCNFGKKGKKENIAKHLREDHFTDAHKNGEMKYCEEEVSLIKPVLGTDGEKTKFTVAQGEKSYPFNFKLPVKLPSSFKGNWGSISYELKATLDTVSAAADSDVTPYTEKVGFTVYELIDANRTLYKNGFTGNGYKHYGINCFNLNSIEVTGRVDRVCYLPGDMIYIDAQVYNFSDRNVKSLKAKLLQKICYHYKKRTLVEEVVVAKVVSKDMKWDRRPMAVPDISPNVVSELIEKKHVLRLQVDGIIAEIPIIIGSVPFKGQYSCDSDATSSKSPTNGTNSQHSTLTLPNDYRTKGKVTSSDTDADTAAELTRSSSY